MISRRCRSNHLPLLSPLLVRRLLPPKRSARWTSRADRRCEQRLLGLTRLLCFVSFSNGAGFSKVLPSSCVARSERFCHLPCRPLMRPFGCPVCFSTGAWHTQAHQARVAFPAFGLPSQRRSRLLDFQAGRWEKCSSPPLRASQPQPTLRSRPLRPMIQCVQFRSSLLPVGSADTSYPSGVAGPRPPTRPTLRAHQSCNFGVFSCGPCRSNSACGGPRKELQQALLAALLSFAVWFWTTRPPVLCSSVLPPLWPKRAMRRGSFWSRADGGSSKAEWAC